MGLTTFVTSKAGLTKGVVFHKGGPSKGYHCTCTVREDTHTVEPT